MANCLHPIRLKNNQLVPCGRCLNCRNRYRTSWSFRLQEQEKVSDSVYFVTLTYDDDKIPVKKVMFNDTGEIFRPCDSRHVYLIRHGGLPKRVSTNKYFRDGVYLTDEEAKLFFPLETFVYSVDKEEIKKFTDNLQHQAKNIGLKLRYYIASEYGKKRHRPHYHAVLFVNGSTKLDVVKSLIEKVWKKGITDVQILNDMSGINYVTKYAIKGSHTPVGADACFSLKSKGLGENF